MIFDNPTYESKYSCLKNMGRKLRFKTKPQIVMQQREADCGAACFASILKFYGVRKIHLSAVHELLRSGRDGTNFDQLAEAFAEIGINTQPIETTVKLLEDRYQTWQYTNKPIILHWRGNHFVVLYRLDKKGALIADPAIGITLVSHEVFIEKWTGYALLIAPTSSFLPDKLVFTTPSAWAKLSPMFFSSRKTLIAVFILAILLQLLALIQPLGMKYLFDNLIAANKPQFIDLIIGGLLLVIIGEAVVQFIRSLLLTRTEQSLNSSMKAVFYEHLFSLPASYFNRQRVGDLITLNSDTTIIGQLLAGRTLVVALDLLTFITYFGLLFYLQVKLLIIAICLIPLYALTVYISAQFLQKLYRINFAKSAELQSFTLEHLSGMTTIKALAIEDQVAAKLQQLIITLQENQIKTVRLRLISGAINGFFLMGGQTIIFWYGVHLVFSGELTIGSLVAFIAVLGGLMRPAGSVVDLWNDVQQVRLAFERLGTFFATTTEKSFCQPDTIKARNSYDSQPVNVSSNEIDTDVPESKESIPVIFIENVSYKYHGSGRFDSHALTNINLRIESEKSYGVVGASGSGKSTLAQLLVRFDDPTEGYIYYNGCELSLIEPNVLRREIGYVSQDVYLFNTTIYENIAYGNLNVTEDDVRNSAEIVGAADFIKAMPRGYQTMLNERGMGLSGGQRQRLALARMICRQPRLLILDEATSALDLKSEESIYENLKPFFRKRTTIIISHREETMKYADQIIKLDRGKLS